MSTNNTKSGSPTTGIGLVGLWTVLATVFHFAGFGAFAEWPVIAWPWHCGSHQQKAHQKSC